MTLEEAQSLGPGDSIRLEDSNYIRQIVKCYVAGDRLKWDELRIDGSVDKGYGWYYSYIVIVSKAHNTIINNEYSIY